MRKTTRRIVSGFLAVVMLLSYIPMTAVASTETDSEITMHKVVFVADGSEIVRQDIADGKSAVEPDAPLVKGKRFVGWDKNFDSVTGDITVTALYEDITSAEIRIEYVFENGSTAAAPHIERAAVGTSFETTVVSPDVPGFTTEDREVSVKLDSVNAEGYTVRVVYKGTPNEYTVKHLFELADGTYREESETFNGTVGLLTDAKAREVAGYTSEPFEQQIVAAEGNTIVEIKYFLNAYLVNWDTDGGSYVEPSVLKAGAQIVRPALNPTKRGYVFVGWDNIPEAMPDENITVKAKWEAARTADYKVVYWGESLSGGYDYFGMETGIAGVGSVIPYKTNLSSVTLPEGLVKDGFELDTARTGGNVTVTADGDAVKNVYFNRKTFTVEFYNYERVQTGTGWGGRPTYSYKWVEDTDLRITAKYGKDISSEWKASSSGSIWKISEDSSNVYSAVSAMPAGGLKAYYSSDAESGTNSVIYEIENLDGSYSTYTSSTGSSFSTLGPEDIIDINGYSFSKVLRNGSEVSADSDGTYTGFAENSGSSWRPNYTYYDAVIRYARNRYSIVFGNCTGVSSASVKYEASVSGARPADSTVSAPASVDSDSIFAGWYTSPACEDGTEFDWNSKMPAHNVVVYAKWEKPSYTVKFVTGNADISIGDITVEKYTVIEDRIPEITESGFLGWYKDAEFKTPFSASQQIVSDLTLYARWDSSEKVYYVLNIVNEEGQIIRQEKIYVKSGTYVTIEAPEIPGMVPEVSSQQIFVDKDGIEVSFKYAYPEPWTATVKHLDFATGEEVLPEETISVEVNYSILAYTGSIFGYEVSGSYVQTVDKANPEAVFYYKSIPNPTYTVKYMLNDGVTEIKPSETRNDAKAGFEAGAAPADIDGYTYIAPAQKIPVYVEKDGSAVVVFTYKADTAEYTVRHFVQNADNDDLVQYGEDEIMTGVVGADTQAVAKYIDGVYAQSFAQKKISGDGSTVVEIYYYRNVYDIVYKITGDIDANEEYAKEQYRYGATVTAVSEPSKVGYTFSGWQTVPVKMPSQSVVVTGYFMPNSDTSYTVKHMIQNLDGNGYTFGGEEKFSGTTGELTTAAAKVLTGFTAKAFVQQIISGDGNTAVDIYYDRNEYTVFYKIEGSIDANENYAAKTYLFGQTVEKLAVPEKEGYTFNGWIGEPSEMTAGDVTVTGYYEANTDTKYVVKHMLQNADDDGYAQYGIDVEMVGTTDSETKAEAIEIPGAKAKSFEQKKIAADGSTVVEIFYDRNVYDVVYKITGDIDANEEYAKEQYRYDATVKAVSEPVKLGYTFSGWQTVPVKMPNQSVVVTGYFMPRSDIRYTVRHMKENVNGDGYTLDGIDVLLNGITDALTDAKAKEMPGFTPLPFDQEVVSADGNTVVNIYYNRNRYNVTYKITGDIDANENYAAKTYLFGQTVEKLAVPEKEGYTFVGWIDEPAETMPAENITVTGYFEANTNTGYTVKHMLQNAEDDNYTQYGSVVEMTGTTDAETKAEAIEIPGAEAKAFEQKKIAADGSTIVEIYYDRKDYTVTYKIEGSVDANDSYRSESYRYGKEVRKLAVPAKDGYTFVGWTGEPEKMPAKNVVATGYFSADTDTGYTVVHKLQNIDDDGYSVIKTENLTGVTDENTAAKAIAVTGAYAKAFEQAAIKGDGSTVIEIFYDRYVYDIVYNITGSVDATAEYAKEQYRYGKAVTAVKEPAKDGYTFSGWQTVPETMPAHSVIVEGYFIADTDTVYTVKHMVQNADNDGYTQDGEDVVLHGTTDTLTEAKAREITGMTAAAFEQQTIKGDGSTVVEIYYNRNSYTVTYSVVGSVAPQEKYAERTYRFGEKIVPMDKPVEAGYDFVGWDNEPSEMPAGNITVTGRFEARTDTVYTVRHMIQNVAGNGYSQYGDDVVLNGTTDTLTSAESVEITGMTAKAFEQKKIDGNGSTVVEIFYDRNVHTLTYQIDGVNYAEPEEYRYGAEIAPAERPEKEGYTFEGWADEPSLMPDSDVVLNGHFNPNSDTRYSVRYFIQNIDNDEYTQDGETLILQGVTDSVTEVSAPEKVGMTAKEVVQNIIRGDGSTVIDVYYDRNTYTVTYRIDGDVDAGEKTVGYRYGAGIVPESVPVKDGYTFAGWFGEPSEMPAENVTVTGSFNPNSYKVNVNIYLDRVLNEELSFETERDFGTVYDFNASAVISADDAVYALDRVNNNGFTVSYEEERNLVEVYYSMDSKGNPDPENPGEDEGDGEPDEYQTIFKFISAGNGSVNGAAYETYTDETHTEKPSVSPRAEVTPVPDDGFAFDFWTDENGNIYRTEDEIRAVGTSEDKVFTAHFETDNLTDPNFPTDSDGTGDGVPDKYQAAVTFTVYNGIFTFADGRSSVSGSTVVTLYDENGNYSENGRGVLNIVQVPSVEAADGYNADSLMWIPAVPVVGYEVFGNINFTAGFELTEIPAPETPEEPYVPVIPVTPTPPTVEIIPVVPTPPAPVGPAPEVPETPETPVVPEVPETPVNPPENIDDPEVPLAPSKPEDNDKPGNEENGTEHSCCILHLLILLAALVVEIFYINSVNKHQKKIFELRTQNQDSDKETK